MNGGVGRKLIQMQGRIKKETEGDVDAGSRWKDSFILDKK